MKRILVLAALVASFGSAQAATLLTQWNFNSPTPDGNTGTGTLTPSVGSGTAVTVGGTSSAFATGNGSSDPAATDDSGWNISAFKPQATGNKQAGAEFRLSTLGYTGIKFTFDQRHSNSSANLAVVQYSLDEGATWVEAASFTANAGDTWFINRTVDLTSVSAVDNKADIRFRVVAAFNTDAGYKASNPTSNYATSGTWRFDMVSLTAEQPVPEPGTMAALGLGAAAMLRRRRK